LPSHFGETLGKVCVAEPSFAVPVLPCVDARQCLCRAILCLCRAICPHDKALFSGSAVDQQGGGDFRLVQSAVNFMPDGNREWIRIHVKSGSYRYI
jgi:hypothetical protein